LKNNRSRFHCISNKTVRKKLFLVLLYEVGHLGKRYGRGREGERERERGGWRKRKKYPFLILSSWAQNVLWHLCKN
jgi:hypothetical protein